MSVSPRLRTWSLLGLVNLGWAAQYPAYRIASDRVGVAGLNFWTFAIAGVVIFLYIAYRRRRGATAAQRLTMKDVVAYNLLSILGLIPPSVLMAWGIAHSSASNASILSLTIPVLMTLMGIVMLRERPARLVWLSLACACAGTALISWTDIAAGRIAGTTLLGNVAVFLSGAGAAFYNAYCKRLLTRHTAAEILVYGYVAAAVQCAVISFYFDPSPFYQVAGWSTSVWLAVVVLGGIVWGVAMLLWMHVLGDLELGQISVSVYMLPVFGLALSALTLGERIGAIQVAGAAIVMASAYLTSGPPAEAREAEANVANRVG